MGGAGEGGGWEKRKSGKVRLCLEFEVRSGGGSLGADRCCLWGYVTHPASIEQHQAMQSTSTLRVPDRVWFEQQNSQFSSQLTT